MDKKEKSKFFEDAKGKTSVFIDASNIYFSQKKIKWQIDFKKLLDFFQNELDLSGIFYYTARDLKSGQQTKFLNYLEMIGYKIRSKKVKFINKKDKINNDGYLKGNLDIELALDAVETKDKYDTIILISGDSDFEPLLQLLKNKYKKRCLVMASKYSISIELIKCARYINLAKLKKYISR